MGMPGKYSGLSHDKARFVKEMFSSIAYRYDLLNTLLSFNRDKYWREFTASKTGLKNGGTALDVATGTGELALELKKTAGVKGQVVGVDFCGEMLDIARKKTAGMKNGKIELVLNDAEALPFPDNTFDCATIGFSLRNVRDIGRVLGEMRRVVRKGGRVISLEFSKPSSYPFKNIYNFYFYKVLPKIGRLISKSNYAYTYLPNSLINFPSREKLKEIMEDIGLKDIEYYELTKGIVTLYIGVK